MKKILVIGYGNMGSAFAKRWVDTGKYSVTAVSPSVKPSYAGISFLASIDQILDESYDVVLFSIKPQILQSVATSIKLKGVIEKSKILLSILAGTSMESLEAIYPNSAIVKMMPNLPIEIGKGVSSVLLNKKAGLLEYEVNNLLSCFGAIVELKSEKEFTSFSAIFGSGCGYFFYILWRYIKIAEECGLGNLGVSLKDLVLKSLDGVISYAMINNNLSMNEMVAKVESKGGMTKAGLDIMRGEKGGDFSSIEDMLREVVNSSINRSIELGNESKKLE